MMLAAFWPNVPVQHRGCDFRVQKNRTGKSFVLAHVCSMHGPSEQELPKSQPLHLTLSYFGLPLQNICSRQNQKRLHFSEKSEKGMNNTFQKKFSTRRHMPFPIFFNFGFSLVICMMKVAPSSGKKRELGLSFQEGTDKKDWKSPSGKKFVVQYMRDIGCDRTEWPTISMAQKYVFSDMDEEGAQMEIRLCGAVWDDDELVAFWAEDLGDGHIDFFVKDGIDGMEDLDGLSDDLCLKIHPPLRDIFDDGSGTTREGCVLPAAIFKGIPLD